MEGFFNELLDGPVDAAVLGGMQIVDVAGKPDTAVGRELDISPAAH